MNTNLYNTTKKTTLTIHGTTVLATVQKCNNQTGPEYFRVQWTGGEKIVDISQLREMRSPTRY